jgi:hypothetical protein
MNSRGCSTLWGLVLQFAHGGGKPGQPYDFPRGLPPSRRIPPSSGKYLDFPGTGLYQFVPLLACEWGRGPRHGVQERQ